MLLSLCRSSHGPQNQAGAQDSPYSGKAPAYLGNPGQVGHKKVQESDQAAGLQIYQGTRQRQIGHQREQDVLPPGAPTAWMALRIVTPAPQQSQSGEDTHDLEKRDQWQATHDPLDKVQLIRSGLLSGEQGRHTHPNLLRDNGQSIRVGVEEQGYSFLLLRNDGHEGRKVGNVTTM